MLCVGVVSDVSDEAFPFFPAGFIVLAKGVKVAENYFFVEDVFELLRGECAVILELKLERRDGVACRLIGLKVQIRKIKVLQRVRSINKLPRVESQHLLHQVNSQWICKWQDLVPIFGKLPLISYLLICLQDKIFARLLNRVEVLLLRHPNEI